MLRHVKMQTYLFGYRMSLAFFANGPKKSTALFLKIMFSVFGILKSGGGAICSCIALAFCRRQSKHRLIIVRKLERKLITIGDC